MYLNYIKKHQWPISLAGQTQHLRIMSFERRITTPCDPYLVKVKFVYALQDIIFNALVIKFYNS